MTLTMTPRENEVVMYTPSLSYQALKVSGKFKCNSILACMVYYVMLNLVLLNAK